MNLLTVPLYLRYLGLEAYGVVGLFSSLSALIAFLDLGLGTTLTRELARISGSSSALPEGRNLTRTFEVIYAAIALLIGLVVIGSSILIANYWITLQALSPNEVARGLALAGLALACQWPSNLYSAGLAGMHRQIQLSVTTIVFATLRVGVTLAAIWWKPNLEAFFLAHLAVGLLQTMGLRTLLWRELSLSGHRPIFTSEALRRSQRFALDMTAITVISVVLTQADKIVLSNALSLQDFGSYVVASTLAAGLYMIIGPIFSVMYPRLSTLVTPDKNTELIAVYHTGCQVLSGLLLPLVAILICFPKDILFIWTGDLELSESGANILAALALGNACNGLMNMPYALQLAYGWTRLAVWINATGLILLIPTAWLAAKYFGALGGAMAWLALNAGYLILWPQLLHGKIQATIKNRWYLLDTGLPFLVSTLSAYILSVFYGRPETLSRYQSAVLLLILWATTMVLTNLSLPAIRSPLIQTIFKTRNKAA